MTDTEPYDAKMDFRCYKAEREALERIAESQGIPLSDLLRVLIRREIKREGKRK